eukprot:symbB.v1.2.020017.t1/scaffold1662.1/size108665/5
MESSSAECPALPLLYRLEVRMDREHRELQQQMQRLDVPDKDSERRGESAEWLGSTSNSNGWWMVAHGQPNMGMGHDGTS